MMEHCSRNGGCKFVAYWLVLLLLNVGLMVQYAVAQQSSFYFAQNQGRFVPSYESPRNGFFPSSIQRNQPPDSYQEQTLFVGSSAANGGGRPGRGQTGTSHIDSINDDGPLSSRSGATPSYFQFTYTTPRSPDVFEISPRPFSVTPQPQNSGFQYTRGSSLRTSDFFSNGLSPPSIPSRSFSGGVVGSSSSGTSGFGSSISSGGISSSGSSHSYRQTQRKSPFSSGAIGTSLTTDSDSLQRPETGGRDRDRQHSFISSRARPFGNDDSSSSSSSVVGGSQPSRGFLGSTSATFSSASNQRTPQRLPPSAARNNGFRSKSEDQVGGSGSSSSGHHQQNDTNNGSSSGRFTKPTPRVNRYRSTTTAEPVTAKSTTVESVVLRNRFGGRTSTTNSFRPAFEAKKVAPVSSNAAAPSSTSSRGTFVNKSKKTTTTTTTTTTAKAPAAAASLSRFIIPARPIIPSINITHNGSAKSAEVIYDYDDYVEDPKDPANNEFVDEPQEIKDFQQPTSQKNNSIKSSSSEKEEKPLVVSTTSSAPTSTTAKEYENEERGGSLNNINENEYYDVVKENDGQQQQQQQQVGENIEDHTVILTDNFYLPNSGSEEVLDDEEEEEEDYTEEPKKEVPSSVAPAQEEQKEQLSDSAYDDEYIYDEDEPAVSTTVRPEVKPAVAPAVEEPKEEVDTLIFSEEENQKSAEGSKVEEEAAPALSEEVIAETTRAAPIETTSTTTPATTTTEAPPTQETSTTTERTLNSSVDAEPTSNATTESWVVVASVQTSRSVSGARFLPFPQVEQDEKKQSLSELDSKNSNENDEAEITTISSSSHEIEKTTIAPQEPVISVTNDSETPTTEKSVIALSTESIIDKLDRVQSELSSGIFKDLPVLKEMITEDSKIPTSSSLPPVVIRKFQPNGRVTTTKKPRVFPTTTKPTTTPAADLTKKIVFDEVINDEIAALLPPDFKQKNAYKIKKFGVSSTTHVPIASDRDVLNEEPLRPDLGNRFRPANSSRSYKSSVPIQELSSQLPKERNRTEEEVKTTNNLKELISKIKGNEKPNGTVDVLKKVPNVDISSFLPPGYKPAAEATTKTPAPKTIEDDVSKLLPPGYRGAFKPSLKKTTTTTVAPAEDDDLVSKLLPPGYSPPKNEPKLVFSDDISKFLPPGYKPSKEDSSTKAPVVFSEDISKFLPPGYKPPAEEAKPEPEVIDPTSLLSKIKFKEVAVPLPPGFNETKPEPPASTSTANAGFKVVFPSRPGVKKPGQGRITTPKPLHAEGPAAPEIAIRRGPPTRATTEFTGWPTPSTTPLSIEKLLEQQKQQELLEKLLVSSSTSTTTTTTTTTSTTTPRPTEPGLCHSECDLAGTIRIVDGVKWVPELLDHNTAEWKQLAKEVEAQLNEVYSKAQNLSKWYKKVRIDSFSKGSVLVDYFVELTDLTHDVNTLEIKKLFHEALTPAPVPTTTTPEPSTDMDEEGEEGEDRQSKQTKENLQTAVPRVKEVFLLGKFKVDPVSTDFTVIPKQILPTVIADEEDNLLPQWAIAVIVIGLASLLFVILFGVTVLINRQKAAKKKAPTPLTADMLNELNKNHMGGIDNYGAEDLYNLDDAWEDQGHDVKPKRFSNSMHGSSASNIYDSWRSQRHPNEGNYYYDDYGGLKGSHYPPSGHGHSTHQYPVAPAHRLHDAAFMMHEPPLPVMGMYPPYHHAPPPPSSHYNTNSRRHYRDYDPNF